MYVDKNMLVQYGKELQEKIAVITKEVYNLTGEEFNINSPKQLGEVLFEKLGLPSMKKTKTGYSTDNDVLEKLADKHPVIEKLLEYRQLMKLNSTYVEGLIPYINENTRKNSLQLSSNCNSNRQNKQHRSKFAKHSHKNGNRQKAKKSIQAEARMYIYRCRLFPNRA